MLLWLAGLDFFTADFAGPAAAVLKVRTLSGGKINQAPG
jgi:hypothetical protein